MLRFVCGTFLVALAIVGVLLVGCTGSHVMPTTSPSADEPPPAPREFRGAWVATVGNIDWPTKPGESTDQQKKEAIAILDRCVDLNINAVIFQVRPAADAMYASSIEPWSYYLTGEQGKPPSPFYDPLKFWIQEAHARGIELHAWFNPFRANVNAAGTKFAPNHISQTNPSIVKDYREYLWLDPGEPARASRLFASLWMSPGDMTSMACTSTITFIRIE